MKKRDQYENNKDYKKAIVGIWGRDEDSYDSNQDEVANLCLMAIGDNTNNVSLHSNSSSFANNDNEEFDLDELLEVFVKVRNKNKAFKRLSNSLKKELEATKFENISLASEIAELVSKNKELFS